MQIKIVAALVIGRYLGSRGIWTSGTFFAKSFADSLEKGPSLSCPGAQYCNPLHAASLTLISSIIATMHYGASP